MEIERGRTEGKIRETTEMMHLQQIELDKKDIVLKELESTQKQLAEELEKCHSHIEEQNKYIQELKDENKYIPQLSTKIKECTKRIEQISSEVDNERQKAAKFKQDNETLIKELENLKYEFSGENDPEYLKQQIISHKEFIEELELARTNLQIKMKEQTALGKEWESRYEQESELITEELRNLLAFIEGAFTDLKSTDFPEVPSDGKLKNQTINYCLDEIKKSIKNIKGNITKNMEILETENLEAKKELEETLSVKNDIMGEIERFKGLLEEQEKNLKEKEELNSNLSTEISELKSSLEKQKEENINLQNTFNEITKETYENLFSVITKYEGIDFVTSRVNLKPNAEFEKDKKAALIELVSILADITNILNFEIKSLNIKVVDMEAEKQRLEKMQNETIEEAKRLEKLCENDKKQMENEFNQKQEQFEILTTNYEKHNAMLAKEIDHCKEDLKKQEEAFKISAAKTFDANEKSNKLQKACEVYLRAILSLTRKVEDLAEQKALAQKELKTFVGLSSATQGQLNALGTIAEEEAKLDLELQTLKPSLLRTTTTEGEQLATELQKHKKYVHALKFRKAAITIIAANRLNNLLKRSQKEKRYGNPINKYGTISQFLADSLLQTTVPESTGVLLNKLNSLIEYISIIPNEQFPENSLKDLSSRITDNFPTKPWSSAEECKLLVQSLEELHKLENFNKNERGIIMSPLMSEKSKKISAKSTISVHGTLIDFLQDGLASIKSKYSWLHLGIPLELLSNDIKYIDTVFYKDLISQEDSKKVEKALNQLKLIPQLKTQLELAKEREEALSKQLANCQMENKEYEENVKKLMSAVDELQIKEATMVTADAYEEANRNAETKNREIEQLTSDLVFLLSFYALIGKCKI